MPQIAQAQRTLGKATRRLSGVNLANSLPPPFSARELFGREQLHASQVRARRSPNVPRTLRICRQCELTLTGPEDYSLRGLHTMGADDLMVEIYQPALTNGPLKWQTRVEGDPATYTPASTHSDESLNKGQRFRLDPNPKPKADPNEAASDTVAQQAISPIDLPRHEVDQGGCDSILFTSSR